MQSYFDRLRPESVSPQRSKLIALTSVRTVVLALQYQDIDPESRAWVFTSLEQTLSTTPGYGCTLAETIRTCAEIDVAALDSEELGSNELTPTLASTLVRCAAALVPHIGTRGTIAEDLDAAWAASPVDEFSLRRLIASVTSPRHA